MTNPRTPAGGAGAGESVGRTARQTHDTAPDRPVQPSLFDVPAADANVLAGRDRAERNGDDWWVRTALQAVRAAAKTGQEFQAFDLVETYGVPEPDHPNRWGALLTRAARDGVIVAVGAAPSRRPSTARSLTRTWRGAP